MQVIRTDSTTGAPTLLYTIVTDRGISWEHACQLRATDSPVERNGVVDLEPAAHGESATSITDGSSTPPLNIIQLQTGFSHTLSSILALRAGLC